MDADRDVTAGASEGATGGSGAPVVEAVGGTLRDALTQRGPLPWSEAVAIAVAVAEALDAAHAEATPALHRELTPENVVLAGEGVRLRREARRAGGSGALRYMSPEQIDARPLDARADLYVLGLLLYEALAGAPPFVATSPRELMNQQCTGAPPPLADAVRRDLPRGVEELLFALLAKGPSERPAAARDVIDRLGPFRPAVTARGTRPAPPRSRTTRRRAPLEPGRARAVLDWLRAARPVPNAVVLLVVALLTFAAGATTYGLRARAPAVDLAR